MVRHQIRKTSTKRKAKLKQMEKKCLKWSGQSHKHSWWTRQCAHWIKESVKKAPTRYSTTYEQIQCDRGTKNMKLIFISRNNKKVIFYYRLYQRIKCVISRHLCKSTTREFHSCADKTTPPRTQKMAGAASSTDGAKKPRSTLHISDTWSLMRERHERQIPAIDVVQCRGTYLFGPMYVVAIANSID